MTIADVHNFIYFIIRKTKNEMVSHEHIDDALHAAQLSRFSDLLPAPSNPGIQPLPQNKIEYGTSANGMDYLFPFKKKKDFLQQDTLKGLLKLETDYAHLRAVYVLSYNNKYQRTKYIGIPILNENQLADRLSSQIINPTPDRPVAIEVYADGKAIQIYPQQGFAGRYYYFSTPIKPKYAYTMNGRVETQDLSASVDLQWDEESTNKIIWVALTSIGVVVNEPMEVQLAQYKQQS